MNYLMVDISGKVPNYDIALCEALAEQLPAKDKLELLSANIDPKKIQCKSKKLISLVPKKFQNSENKVKRGLKALEGLLNYLYIALRLLFSKVDILHLQWLPFLEVASVESKILKIFKIFSPKTKLILTVHNIYPHNFNDSRKLSYKNRFAKVEGFFDKFIVHLQVSKKEFCNEFGIDENRVEVIHHGVFEPKGLKIKPHKRGEKLNIIMYGNQSYYKGTDILVDAIALLPKEVQAKVHTLIVGKTAPDYLAMLKEKAVGLDIEFIPEFVPDDFLNEKIMESDVIVLPYRQISQSGVLLLALYFERMIITSDLPSFRETLENCNDNMFFKKEQKGELSKLINKIYYDDEFCRNQNQIICNLREKYTWERIAKKYCHLFVNAI